VQKLSTKQQQILDFVREYHADRSYMPSVREIQSACEISSTSVVDYNLRLLEKQGYVRRSPDISRGLELVGIAAEPRSRAAEHHSEIEFIEVPVIGTIAAGLPIPVPEAEGWSAEDSEKLTLPPELTPRHAENLFALRVKGYSMIDALITDGDIVILRPAQEASNGDMVAAWLPLEETATLKRFYLEGDQVRLQPENAQMEPIMVPADQVQVHGRVIGVVRRIAG
jgi:repressor LexA